MSYPRIIHYTSHSYFPHKAKYVEIAIAAKIYRQLEQIRSEKPIHESVLLLGIFTKYHTL